MQKTHLADNVKKNILYIMSKISSPINSSSSRAFETQQQHKPVLRSSSPPLPKESISSSSASIFNFSFLGQLGNLLVAIWSWIQTNILFFFFDEEEARNKEMSNCNTNFIEEWLSAFEQKNPEQIVNIFNKLPKRYQEMLQEKMQQIVKSLNVNKKDLSVEKILSEDPFQSIDRDNQRIPIVIHAAMNLGHQLTQMLD